MGKFLWLMTTCFMTYFAWTDTFLFNRKTDCLVSEWSAWSEPFGFGSVSRERKILRYPQHGGAKCQTDLKEVKYTGKQPTVEQTAQAITTNFIVQNRRINSVYGIGTTVRQLRDLLIIVDSSGSIGYNNFNDAKFQLSRLLGYLCPVPDPFNKYQQAALIEFSGSVKEIFDFNDYSNTLQVQNGVESMTYMNGDTCTASAFKYARTNMFKTSKDMRSRADVKQEVLILSDGQSNCGGNATAEAIALHSTADVFGLMIGVVSEKDRKELSSYVSEPLDEHLFALENFQDLKRLVDLIDQQLKCIKLCSVDYLKIPNLIRPTINL